MFGEIKRPMITEFDMSILESYITFMILKCFNKMVEYLFLKRYVWEILVKFWMKNCNSWVHQLNLVWS